ncbi:hypothetical protein ACFFX1_02045 [Dactylosporangium sucinum]|uniref:Condensation domain-containing protein n=1 Tax=Dactylosporangium sucinum TaxID=1424081 RepID=A0A917WI85_9ACTN|nr:hypothetical protein [Dactylosporangium sucinum]GGM08350.1 hypothetical protein GCM10007977_006710 [Dactylosporangium sucinum]
MRLPTPREEAAIVERLEVPFEGDGAGRGPLSWGQIESWNAIRTLGHWMPLGGAVELEPGTTLEDVLDELRWHMCRHVTLRTLLRFDGETPTQEVFGSGSLTVLVYDDLDVGSVVDAYRDRPLDFAVEWPIRAAVIRRDGEPTHLVALLSHFATDGAGAQIMLREVRERPATPVEGLAPLAQARWQESPAGRRQNTGAQRHFEAVLRAMPPVRFPVPAAPASPRYWRGVLDSVALDLALRVLTARLDVDPAATLLAVFAAAVGETSGLTPVVVRPVVSNRFRAGLAGVVCTATQAGLCLIDTSGPFDEVVDRARRAALSGFKHAYFDQRDLWASVTRIGAERGSELQIGCFLNDRRGAVPMDSPSLDDLPPSLDDLPPSLADLPPSSFTWITRQDHPGLEPLILDVESLAEGLRLTVHTDTRWVAPADSERLLWAMEEIALRECPPSPAPVRPLGE